MTGGEHADHLVLALRRDDEVAFHVVEFALEDWAVPVEVAAFLLNDRRMILDLDAVEVALQSGNIHNQSIKSSSSA